MLSEELLNNYEEIKKQNETLEELKSKKQKLTIGVKEEIEEILRKNKNSLSSVGRHLNIFIEINSNDIILKTDVNLNNIQLEEIKKILGFNIYTLDVCNQKIEGYDSYSDLLEVRFYNVEEVLNNED